MLNAGMKHKMQESLDQFTAACKKFGLTINTQKTEVFYQPAPAVPYTDLTVTVGGEKLAWQIGPPTLAALYQRQ